jgi:hypothetical protein
LGKAGDGQGREVGPRNAAAELAGNCCPGCASADFNGDDDIGIDAEIEAFFRVLAGSPC